VANVYDLFKQFLSHWHFFGSLPLKGHAMSIWLEFKYIHAFFFTNAHFHFTIILQCFPWMMWSGTGAKFLLQNARNAKIIARKMAKNNLKNAKRKIIKKKI
jgi:hypothetical protein